MALFDYGTGGTSDEDLAELIRQIEGNRQPSVEAAPSGVAVSGPPQFQPPSYGGPPQQDQTSSTISSSGSAITDIINAYGKANASPYKAGGGIKTAPGESFANDPNFNSAGNLTDTGVAQGPNQPFTNPSMTPTSPTGVSAVQDPGISTAASQGNAVQSIASQAPGTGVGSGAGYQANAGIFPGLEGELAAANAPTSTGTTAATGGESVLSSIGSGLSNAGTAVGQGVSNVASSVGSGLSSAGSAIASGASSVGSAVGSGLSAAGSGIASAAGGIASGVGAAGSAIGAGVGAAGSAIAGGAAAAGSAIAGGAAAAGGAIAGGAAAAGGAIAAGASSIGAGALALLAFL